MDNHFHLLVRVPLADSVPDQELIRRYRILYPKPTLYQSAAIEVMVKELKNNGCLYRPESCAGRHSR